MDKQYVAWKEFRSLFDPFGESSRPRLNAVEFGSDRLQVGANAKLP